MQTMKTPPAKPETAGELRKPEPFTGKDPKKLKAFIFQCQLYFRSSSAFEEDSNRVTFALSYLRENAQDWFEPGVSGQTQEPPNWLYDWEAFVYELQSNFGPYDETADIEHELSNLRMKDTQRISEYLVKFNSLAVRCSWGEPALRFRFYDGSPARLKDEISKGEGKPRTLTELRERAKNIDARYWERQAERSREQHQGQKQSKQTTTTSTATTSTSTPSTSSKTPSRTTDQKTPKNKDAKPTTP